MTSVDTVGTMRLFAVVARSGSFSAAGRMLGLSPSAVSRRIDALEISLGVQLINRTSRKLTLTGSGELYLKRSAQVLEDIETLESDLTDCNASPKGVLHVHTRLHIAMDYINPFLPAFLKKYPDLHIKLWVDEEWHDLIEHQIDVAIRIGNVTEPSLTVKKLSAGQARVVVASPKYLAEFPEVQRPKDLEGHNCLVGDLNGRTLYDYQLWHFRNSSGSETVRVTGNLSANNAEILKTAVVAGDGIVCLPKWVVLSELNSGEMVEILSEYEATTTIFDHSLYAVFHRRSLLPRKVRVFLDYFGEHFKQQSRAFEEPKLHVIRPA